MGNICRGIGNVAPPAPNATHPTTDRPPSVPAAPPARGRIGVAQPGMPPRPRRAAAAEDEPGLVQLPQSLVREVAAHLTERELLRLADTESLAIRTAIARPALEARLRHIHDLGDFMLALNGNPQRGVMGIVHLPAERQLRAFVSLGTRINDLPQRERPQAIAAWMRAPYAGPADATLAGMRHAAEGGFERLLGREQRIIAIGGPAHADVAGGMSIPEAAERHGFRSTVTNQTWVRPGWHAGLINAGLDHVAARVLQERVTENDHLPTLIARAGFAHPEAWGPVIEMLAASRAAVAAVLRGRPADDIIRSMGFTHQPAIVDIRDAHDRRRVSLGEPVHTLAGANDPAHLGRMRNLMFVALETHGRRLLLEGRPRADVEQQLGLQEPWALNRLERIEADDRRRAPAERQDVGRVLPGGEAYERVINGGNVEETRQRFGITTPDAIDALQRHSAQMIELTMHPDDHIPTRIQAAGVTHPDQIRMLHASAVGGPGTTAIYAGMLPAEVAWQMGLEEPADLDRLNTVFAEREEALARDDQHYAPRRRATI